MIHRVRSVGATPFRLILVENRQAAGWFEAPYGLRTVHQHGS